MSDMSPLDVMHGLVGEDGRRWGEVAEHWQLQDAEAVLEGDRRLVYITRPRGAAKTQDSSGFALSWLVAAAPPLARAYAVAADRDQGALLIDSAAGFVDRTPELRGVVKVESWRLRNLVSGASVEVLAADAASAFGLRPHLLIADEFAQWRTVPETARLWAALFSALPKVPGSRCVVLTSAGDPVHPAGKLIERARRSDRWYVAELPGPSPWVSAEDLAEQRAELTESQFARFHLNQWHAAEDRLVDPDDLAACVVLPGPLLPERGVRYALGLDVGVRNDRTVATVCHVEAAASSWATGQRVDRGRRVVLDRIEVWEGSRRRPVDLVEVGEWVRSTSAAFNGAEVVFDPYQAVLLAQELEGRGVRTREFVFHQASIGRLATTMHLLLRDRALALPDDERLLDELEHVQLRETSTPGVLRIDHAAGRHDDRVIALALAANHLLSEAALAGPVRLLGTFNGLAGVPHWGRGSSGDRALMASLHERFMRTDPEYAARRREAVALRPRGRWSRR